MSEWAQFMLGVLAGMASIVIAWSVWFMRFERRGRR